MAELAMGLAREAAARAHANWAEADRLKAAEPPTEPPAEAAAPEQPAAAATATTRSGAHSRIQSCKVRTCKEIDPALLFTRFANIVRHFIALEIRIVAGTAPTAGTAPAPAPAVASPRAAAKALAADPRHAPLRDALRRVADRHSNPASALHEAEYRLGVELADDPGQTRAVPEIFARICDKLTFQLDLSKVPDSVLGMPPRQTNRATHPP